MEGGCRYLLQLTLAPTLGCLTGTPGDSVPRGRVLGPALVPCQLCICWIQQWSMTCFPPSRNLLKTPAPGAVQGPHSSPASPQPQDPGCAHWASLPVSQPPPCRVPWSSWGPQSQPAAWGLQAAQGMLAPIPVSQEEPSACALPHQPPSWCWGVLEHATLGYLKCSQSHPAARGSDGRFGSRGQPL